MELKIVKFDNAVIEINFEELKQQLKDRISIYDNLELNEDNIEVINDSKKDLKKLFDAVETKRKELKKALAEPYNQLEAKIKELETLINEPLNKADSFLKEIEERRKENKKKEIEEYFKKVNNNEYIKFEDVFTTDMLNKTKSMKEIKSIIDLFVKKVENDLLIIGENVSLKSYYLQNKFDLGKTLLEQRRQEEMAKPKPEVQPVPQPVAQPQPIVQPTVQPTVQHYKISFTIEGTKEEILKVSEFLKNNKIKYTRL